MPFRSYILPPELILTCLALLLGCASPKSVPGQQIDQGYLQIRSTVETLGDGSLRNCLMAPGSRSDTWRLYFELMADCGTKPGIDVHLEGDAQPLRVKFPIDEVHSTRFQMKGKWQALCTRTEFLRSSAHDKLTVEVTARCSTGVPLQGSATCSANPAMFPATLCPDEDTHP